MIERGKPKILIAISNIAIGGGAEKVAVELAKRLQAEGHELVLLTFYSDTTEHRYTGTRVSRHETTPASLWVKIPRALARIFFIKKMCRGHRVDVVISFLEESNYYCLLSKVLLGNRVPMIVSVRLDPRFYNRLYKFLIRNLYPRATKVVAVTKYVEKILREEFSLTNTTTIYNPIDTAAIADRAKQPLPEAWAHLKTEDALVVSIGRLTKQKGQWHLIRAFTQVTTLLPTARLVILGDGEYRTQLSELIQACGLEENVYLPGRYENVYPFLKAADLFVFSSLWEGMPNTVLEALAMRLPIVATDCDSGPREVIAPELTITAKVTYPYEATYGILIEPFETTDEPIWDAPSHVPLSVKEKSLADAMITSYQRRQPNVLLEEDIRFDPVTISTEWQKLASQTV